MHLFSQCVKILVSYLSLSLVPAFIITDVEQYNANHLFSQEALDDACWTFSMSYSMGGDATLQKRTPGKECFNGNKGAIHTKRKAFSNTQWIDTLLQSCARILERSATKTQSYGTEYRRNVSFYCMIFKLNFVDRPLTDKPFTTLRLQ